MFRYCKIILILSGVQIFNVNHYFYSLIQFLKLIAIEILLSIQKRNPSTKCIIYYFDYNMQITGELIQQGKQLRNLEDFSIQLFTAQKEWNSSVQHIAILYQERCLLPWKWVGLGLEFTETEVEKSTKLQWNGFKKISSNLLQWWFIFWTWHWTEEIKKESAFSFLLIFHQSFFLLPLIFIWMYISLSIYIFSTQQLWIWLHWSLKNM